MPPRFRPIAAGDVAPLLAHRFADLPGLVRVAIDGAPCAQPELLADSLAAPVQLLGRPFVHVRAGSFWRDASLRLEYGHEDADEYLNWLDTGALRREVLDGGGWYLPSLRDPVTNRTTRAEREPLPDSAVLVVSGAFLLGARLPFEQAVHVYLSPAARARRTPPDEAWTLPAFETYEAQVCPTDAADVVLKVDDPGHPAIRE